MAVVDHAYGDNKVFNQLQIRLLVVGHAGSDHTVQYIQVYITSTCGVSDSGTMHENKYMVYGHELVGSIMHPAPTIVKACICLKPMYVLNTKSNVNIENLGTSDLLWPNMWGYPQIVNCRFWHLDLWMPSGLHICMVKLHIWYIKLKLNYFRMHTHIVQDHKWFGSQIIQILVKLLPSYNDHSIYRSDIVHISLFAAFPF
jgi:hypothetical protein